MRLPFLFLLLFSLLSASSFAQVKSETFTLNTSRKTNILFSGIGLSSAIGGALLERSVDPYSVNEIDALTIPKLNKLDAQSINWYSTQFASISNVLEISSIALPLSLFALKRSKSEHEQLLFQWSQVTSLTYGITTLTKSLAQRDRPFLFNPNASLEEKLKADARLSFFSGHTSISAASWFFFAQHVQRYSSKKWVKTLVWIGAITVPALTGYTRMRAGKHYFTDVAAGYVLGGSIGFFIPKIHAKIGQRQSKPLLH